MHEQSEKYQQRERNYKMNQTNSGAEEYTNWTDNFNTGISGSLDCLIKQKKESANLEDRSFEITESEEQKE